MPSDASVAPSPLGFEPLRRIANNIYLFEPKVTDTPVYGPSLIVLTTWVGGVTPRKVQKYIAGHRGLWPGAAILLIITRATDVGLLPTRVLLSNIAPARDAIRRHVDARLSEKNGPSIMLHIFSNGGLFMAVSLIQSLRAREQGRIPLDLSPHIHGVVFDCTPGRTEFWRLYKAAIVGFTKSPLVVRTLGQAFAAMVSAILVSGQHLGVIDEGVDVLRDKV
ncbi:hypothetical protein ESCO_005596 [Escovopsis weberi]|uniref:Transmembrane protein 53 n=1 Tax=Escovopsis weberi TaxID=150374 RepID=A0A0M8MW93_ESCWE|nr:hypothetical protein ESCO_005596 [Escovopsis weberi]